MTCIGCRKSYQERSIEDIPLPQDPVVIVPPTPADPLGAIDFEYVGTVTSAASQSTAWGKSLQGMTAYSGKIYIGYGDWVANTGPITPWRYTPGGALESTGFATDNECIWHMHVLGGNLWVPYIDPRVSANGELAKFDGSTWTEIDTGIGMYHVFDIQLLNGVLYACGSYRQDDKGIIIHSHDDGLTWQILRVFDSFSRIYFLHAYDGVIGFYGGGQWYSYNGSTWTDGGPILIPTSAPHNNHQLDGTIIYSSAYPNSCNDIVVVADGNSVGGSSRALGLGDTNSWYITATHVQKITSAGFGESYTHNIPGDSCPSSICELDGVIYVGTADSKLYRSITEK